MKKIALLFLFVLFVTDVAQADYVKGYYRNNGTYVNGYNRTSPNNTRLDNYSTRGNYNPYTGQPGTKDPYNYNSGNYNNYGSSSRSTNNYRRYY